MPEPYVCPSCGSDNFFDEICDDCSYCGDAVAVQSAKEVLEVKVTFHFLPKRAETWKEEIVETINRWARDGQAPEVFAVGADGSAFNSCFVEAKRTHDWDNMEALLCGDGRWMSRDGSITDCDPKVMRPAIVMGDDDGREALTVLSEFIKAMDESGTTGSKYSVSELIDRAQTLINEFPQFQPTEG